jgi:flagellum-specific peptidoglycan hydrolase FlgJ
MTSASRPWWQQATALVSLGAGGAITGFSFVPKTAADLTSPSGMPVRLLALEHAAQPAPADEATLRSAIINVASYYLRMAAGKTAAEMQAIIWQHDSVDGADHGASCAAFASLTLELGAQVVGRQSWVTGGSSYPWPLHKWADVRVNPNPASPGVTSIQQDAQAHGRWHALGDGYQPQPGDWVVFDGHVEVVTRYAAGVLHTIGGDSLPDFSVNAHDYSDPLDAQGVLGFVNNGALPPAAHKMLHRSAQAATHQAKDQAGQNVSTIPGAPAARSSQQKPARAPGDAVIPGMPAPAASHGKLTQPVRRQFQHGPGGMSHRGQPAHRARSHAALSAGPAGAGSPGRAAKPQAATAGTAVIPGLPVMAHHLSASPAAPSAAPRRRLRPSLPAKPVHETSAEQAFIGEIAPGAVAAQRRYGVPASVTIAQAIVESGWGQSPLATRDHNLFGIKGSGPAGSVPQQTQEYDNGQLVAITKFFRVYHNPAESIDDHGRHIATSPFYRKSMADRRNPDAFAASLSGVYATDPDYGDKLISLMRRYDLYRYDRVSPAAAPRAAGPAAATIPGLPQDAAAQAPSAPPPAPGAHAATPAAATIPGLPQDAPAQAASASPPAHAASPAPAAAGQPDGHQPASAAVPSTQAVSAGLAAGLVKARKRKSSSRRADAPASPYRVQIPPSVRNAFIASARVPLTRAEPLYRDVASHSGIRWQLLAACDWMQCGARSRYSPVNGEKLGTVNPDGTSYRTKSEALEQCADDMVELARTVYGINVAASQYLSVRDLANVFAAFRWGGLLKLHRTSAMEFPYSVAGLTEQHVKMRWPNIDEPNTPDKPGGRFRMPFGAVPIVLCLDYPATV